MLKTIEFILILFCGISLIGIAFLFNGIEIDKIIYKNISIEKLYLKYDKKLNITAPKITILDENSSNIAKINTHFTLGYRDQNIVIDIKKFALANTDIEASGRVLLNTQKIDLQNKTSFIVKDLILQFDQKLQKVSAEKAFVVFEDNQFDILFEKPFYNITDMSNSKLQYNIDENILKLYLQTESLLNDDLLEILAYYATDIPVKQHKGKNSILANIFIPFSEGKLSIEADIKSQDATFEAYNQILDTTNFDLHYTNRSQSLQGKVAFQRYMISGINFSDANIEYLIDLNDILKVQLKTDTINTTYNDFEATLHDTTLDLTGSDIVFSSTVGIEGNKSFVKLQNTTNIDTLKAQFSATVQYQDESQLYKFQIDNEINLKEHSSEGVVKIDTISSNDLITVKNKELLYSLLFKEEIFFNIPYFGLSYYKKDENDLHHIDIKKPKQLFDLFKFLKYNNNSDGIIEIKSKDFVSTTIDIENLNFDILSKYLPEEEDKEQPKSKKITLPSFPQIDVSYRDSTIKYDDFSLSFDILNLQTNTNNLDLSILKDTTAIELKIKDNILEAHGYNLTDKYMNTFLNKELLEGGYINIHLYTDNINLLAGNATFHNTTLKNVTVINSLTTFVNTTPAIINPLLALPTLYRMAETGFDTNGYYIKTGDGSFHYSVEKKQLDIFDLKTLGKMSNFTVNSNIDFIKNQIDANVSISFLKDFTGAINYIPIVGYIFLGDDGEFYTSVDITGSLDDPILETHTVKESSQGVTNVIKRILTLPLQPFNVETTPQQLEEHNKRVEEMFNN